MKTPRPILLTALMLCLLCAGGALAGNVADEPGYIDLEWIVIPDDAAEIQDIDLGPILGGISADAKEKGDDALVQVLAMIRSIRVKSYSIEDGGNEIAQESVDKVTARMEADDWKRLIYMKDGDTTVSINTRYDGPDLVGLMIVNFEPDDSVVFVNVVGDLDLATLIGLAKQIDHDSIGDMIEGLDGIDGIEIDHDDDDEDDDI